MLYLMKALVSKMSILLNLQVNLFHEDCAFLALNERY
jgi:hypothetical protein